MDCSPPGSSVHGISQARILECHFLFQEIFLTQGLNPHLLHWQVDSLPLSPKGSPYLSIHKCISIYVIYTLSIHNQIHCWYYYFEQTCLLDQLRIRKVLILPLLTPLIFSLLYTDWVSDLYYFPSLKRTPFNTSCMAGLLATNSLNFCLAEKVFISPSPLKVNFAG